MTTGQALLIFLAIPVGFAALIALIVFAAGWTRGARAGNSATAEGGDGTSGPVLITSSAAVPDPGDFARQLPAAAGSIAGGGARGQW